MTELPPKYDPTAVEATRYEQWEKAGYFNADPDSPGEAHTIVIPPPNITGVLHLGHALNGTIQDIITRRRRMQGRNTLWLPGMDHAGIATQHVVSKKLRAEGIDPHEIGREKFLEHIWEWKELHGSTIIRQFKTLGCSCDWRRERFTMDEGLSRAVRRVFKSLFDEGLIYRGDYLVNWSPALRTALSDDEVEHRDVDGHLWHFRYPIKDGPIDGVSHAIVATTRPETMLGDTAIAVNPTDERYKNLIGRTVLLPLMDREIPIIADDFVSTEFGTGMVKVTPAHDPNDYEMGKRHDLTFINILNPDATLNENAGKYEGLSVVDARKRVVEDMEAMGLLEKVEPHSHAVGHCYRSGCVVEPFISKQWFVKMRPLAEPALAAVREGRTKFIPPNWDKTYFQWLDNVRDWCISRQLWWGHRIPVWFCDDCGHEICEIESEPQQCPKCDGKQLTQDPDVLDTWFSSALWPFSTLGWPEQTPELAKYYPTSVLVTAHDIIFFWVARMMMMGLKFMGEVPFAEVYITPLIMAEGGGKMSKSKGNAVDPLVLIAEHGADAVRLSLCSHAARTRTVNYSAKRFEAYRNFTNKLWNAARFVLMNTEDLSPEDYAAGVEASDLKLEDRWIRSQLNAAATSAIDAHDRYEFDAALSALYDFIWKQYCDWYVELVKPRLYAVQKGEMDDGTRSSRTTAQVVLVSALETVLRLLHPIAPFITEEIWQNIRERYGSASDGAANPASASLSAASIMIAPWPEAADAGSPDSKADADLALLQQAVYMVRNIRGEMNVPPGMKTDVEIVSPDADRLAKLKACEPLMISLLNVSELRILDAPTEIEFASTAVHEEMTVRVPLPDELRSAESARLEKEIARIEGVITGIGKKLGNEKFTARAPADVVERERTRLATNQSDLERLRAKRDELA